MGLSAVQISGTPRISTSPVPSAWTARTIVVTGGTGTFGQAFVQHVLAQYPQSVLRCLSRNEHNIAAMRQRFGAEQVRYLLGDVRDVERLQMAFRNADLVIHAAALKQVDFGEYDPLEFAETNINGTRNVIRAAMDQGVGQVILVSSDKAVQPVNLYGATKLVAERLMVQANAYTRRTRFNVVRYGNVFGSRGSVVETYARCLAAGQPLPLTSLDMTRFYMNIHEAVELVCFAAEQPGLQGGLLVPLLPAYRQTDLARAMLGRCEEPLRETDYVLVGQRPGEKRAELLLTDDECARAAERDTLPLRHCCYLIAPATQSWLKEWSPPLGWQPCEEWQYGPYRSDVWPYRLSVTDLAACL